MDAAPRKECSFFVPIRRDAILSDGDLHTTEAWDWLDDQLWDRFRGETIAPGLYSGFYEDPHGGQRVADQSRRYLVAIPPDRLDDLRSLLAEACSVFRQKCIYLSVAGDVEFVEGPDAGSE